MPDFSPQWNELRSHLARFFIVWLGGFILIAASGVILGEAAIWLFPIWLVLFFVAGSRWSLFRCPRCGNPFFKPHDWAVNQLAGRCYHCGLRKWTNGDEQLERARRPFQSSDPSEPIPASTPTGRGDEPTP
jgi:hypothetical protein